MPRRPKRRRVDRRAPSMYTVWDGLWADGDPEERRRSLQRIAVHAALFAFATVSTILLLGAQTRHAEAQPARALSAGVSSSCPAGAAAVSASDLHVDPATSLATATFTVASGCSDTEISLVSYKALSASFGLPQVLYRTSTQTFSAGSAHSLSIEVPGCFFQVDLVVGAAITDLSSGLYGSRLVAALNGGTSSCTSTPPPPCPVSAGGVVGAALSITDRVATGTFSIAPGCGTLQVSLASYETPSASFSFPQTLHDSATGFFGPGGPYTLKVDVPPCFYQVDLARGPVIPDLRPDNLYGPRLLVALNGGTACGPPVVTVPTTTTTPSTTTTTTPGTTTGPPPTTSTTTTSTTTTTSETTTTTSETQPPVTTTTSVTATPTPALADVSITKTARPAKTTVGAFIDYTLTVHNAGPATAEAVTVAENLPTQVSFVSATPTVGSCTGAGPVICSLGNLAAGDTVTIRIRVRARETGTAVNVATVTTTTPETTTTNNRATASVPITGAFVPPTLCAALRLTVHGTVRAGRSSTVTAHAVTGRGTPVAHAKVTVKGPGIARTARTGRNGTVRLTIRARAAGTVEVTLQQASGCEAKSALLPVAPEVFAPPSPVFTG